MASWWSDIDRTFAMMDDFRRRMDRLSGAAGAQHGYAGLEWPRVTGGWPATNLYDTGNALVIQAEIPGLSDKDVHLSVTADTLTFTGERKVTMPEGYTAHRQERTPVKFSRSFTLPSKVNAEKCVATLRDGILIVTLPKEDEEKPRSIQVRVG